MRQRKQVATQDVVAMYTVQHLSLRQIGQIVGMSAVGVQKRLNTAGVDTSKARRISRLCAFCGVELALMRCQVKRSNKSYCSTDCYVESMRNDNYIPWRHGGRLARVLVSQHFRLPAGAVVHHKDGNQRNNNLDNLAVYASQADHTAMHRGKLNVPVLWDGGG
jgi:hypothetical protein